MAAHHAISPALRRDRIVETEGSLRLSGRQPSSRLGEKHCLKGVSWRGMGKGTHTHSQVNIWSWLMSPMKTSGIEEALINPPSYEHCSMWSNKSVPKFQLPGKD